MSKVILIKHADQIIPQVMVERVLKTHTSFFGTVQPKDGQLILDHYTDLPTVEEFMAAQEENKALLTGMFFGQAKTPLLAEDYQPFDILRNEKGQTLVAALIEGEYLFNGGETPHSAEYHMVQDMLIPTVNDLWAGCGGELPKLLEKFKSSLFERSIRNEAINRGVAVLFLADGSVHKIPKGNDLGGTFNEFWASNVLGYAEKSVTEAVAEKPARTGYGRRAVAAITKVIASTDPFKPPVVTQNITKTATDTAVPVDAGRPMIKPHADLVKAGGNRAKGFYENNCTSVPEKSKGDPVDWRDGPLWPANDAYIARNASKFKPIKEGLAEVKEKISSTTPDKPHEHIVPPKVKDQLNALILEDKVKAMIKDDAVLDPKAGDVKKVATFTEQQGWDLIEVAKTYPVAVLERIGKTDIRALALLCRESLDAVKNLLGGEVIEPTKTGVPVTEEVKKQAEAPKPATRPMGFGRRSAA